MKCRRCRVAPPGRLLLGLGEGPWRDGQPDHPTRSLVELPLQLDVGRLILPQRGRDNCRTTEEQSNTELDSTAGSLGAAGRQSCPPPRSGRTSSVGMDHRRPPMPTGSGRRYGERTDLPTEGACSMYRGSRLAASFLLFLTGSAVTTIGLGVAPTAVGGAWPLAALVVTFGVGHFVALVGLAR